MEDECLQGSPWNLNEPDRPPAFNCWTIGCQRSLVLALASALTKSIIEKLHLMPNTFALESFFAKVARCCLRSATIPHIPSKESLRIMLKAIELSMRKWENRLNCQKGASKGLVMFCEPEPSNFPGSDPKHPMPNSQKMNQRRTNSRLEVERIRLIFTAIPWESPRNPFFLDWNHF